VGDYDLCTHPVLAAQTTLTYAAAPLADVN